MTSAQSQSLSTLATTSAASLQAAASGTGNARAEISASDANIDPALLTDRHAAFAPRIKDGAFVPEAVYGAYLQTIKKREPLQDACAHYGITHAKRATLEKLRGFLVKHWYRQTHALSGSGAAAASVTATPLAGPQPQAANASSPAVPGSQLPATDAPSHELTLAGPRQQTTNASSLGGSQDMQAPDVSPHAPKVASTATTSTHLPSMQTDPPVSPDLPSDAIEIREADLDIVMDDDTLVNDYDVGDGVAEAALGSFATGGLEETGQDEDEEDEDDPEDRDLDDDDEYYKFRRDTRVSAAQRTEQNRRVGGKNTQKAMVKSWNIFQRQAIAKRQIRDSIVDEHALLLYIGFSADRCQRNRRGKDIPNTRVGASQIKKEFFGALRIRKCQDARDPTLATRRPATSVYVYDFVKTKMDEALKNAHAGLIAGQDAPDIVANTFLDQLSEETMVKIGHGFLEHRELKSTINGHLAWTMMGASGNRGDDIRALLLCEMQPYIFLHPNGETSVPSVLGLQSEHKASRQGMKTTINPTYTCFIAHRDPTKCPLGAFAIYLHFIHDYSKLDEKYGLDYSVNNTWRPVRLIHGSSAVVPYNETALYNLFVMSYKKAGVQSHLKAHLRRHTLGYKQEKMGVNSNDTSKLGWSRDTYNNTYAPALPKAAILGAHGFKLHEEYKPMWRHVPVPESFLLEVCPMAEANVAHTEGKQNLVGATNYWQMVISLREYLFQCAAAIYQIRPKSSIFCLPALARGDVKQWMTTEFPSQLAALNAASGDPVDLARLQNSILRQAFEELRHQSSLQVQQLRELAMQLALLNNNFNRRTAQFTPLKAPTYQPSSSQPAMLTAVARQLEFGEGSPSMQPASSLLRSTLQSPPFIDNETRASENTGIYEAQDHTLRGFVAPSPHAAHVQRPRTEVDLVLPPLLAFYAPGEAMLPLPPFLGQGSAHWAAVFSKIKQSELLWDAWKPSKTLDQMTIPGVWDCYNTGEAVLNSEGTPTGMKPPLRLVEQYFKSDWRKGSAARKFWQRFREIPEWIETTIKVRGITISAALLELEGMRSLPDRVGLLGTSAMSTLLVDQHKAAAKSTYMPPLSSPSSVALPSDPAPASLGLPIPGHSSPPRKRRAPTIGGRAKQKKARNA